MTKQDITDEQGRTKLMLVLRDQGKEAVQNAMNQQGDLFVTDNDGKTVLFYAAERGDAEIVWQILSSLTGTGMGCQRGALLRIKDNNGILAEDWAKTKNQEEISGILSSERQRIEFCE